MSDTLTTSFYIILSGGKRRGWNHRELRPERIVKRIHELPATKKDEVAIRVNVGLPVALFERPELSVTIAVDGGVPRVDIDAETMDNLAERMQEIIGTPVHVTCDLPESADGDRQ